MGVTPIEDKMMNCGTIVFTMEKRRDKHEITNAEFLFDGHMESYMSSAHWSIESGDLLEFDNREEQTNSNRDLDNREQTNEQGLEDIFAFLGQSPAPPSPPSPPASSVASSP